MESVEDDGGMAADREAKDHFGRREERQERAPHGHVVGVYPLPLEVRWGLS